MINTDRVIYFVYDGECPICKLGAQNFDVDPIFGRLEIINARDNTNHFVIQAINEAGMNLDDGMVIHYNDNLYHGDDALILMGKLGASKGWLNHINRIFFRSETLARASYPSMRGFRNLLLKFKGVSKINNLKEL